MPVTRAPSGRARPSLGSGFGAECRIEPHAQIGPHDGAVLDELVGDQHHHVDRDGEADAFVAAAGAGDGRVDADHFAAQVQQRPAAVAGVDGGVGLQEVLVVHAVVAQLQVAAALGADDAVGDRVAQAERAADGEHEIADVELAWHRRAARAPALPPAIARMAMSVARSDQTCVGCNTRPSASLMLMPVSVEYLMTCRLVST